MNYPDQQVIKFDEANIKQITEKKSDDGEDSKHPCISLFVTFFAAQETQMYLSFDFSFSQDIKPASSKASPSSQVFAQNYKQSLNLKTMEPFSLDWNIIKPNNEYLNHSSLGQNQSAVNSPIKDMVQMTTMLDLPFQVLLRLKNTSPDKELILKKANLQMNVVRDD